MADTALPQYPNIPSGEVLYNAIMATIEPDLLTSMLPKLDEMYRGETPQQAAERAKRYEAAFAEYEGKLNAYLTGLQNQVSKYHKAAIASAESEDREKENAALTTIEQSFSGI